MKKYCLTFDMDWAPDYILEDLKDIIRGRDIEATVFYTHKTGIFDDFRNIEKGLHPDIRDVGAAEQKVAELKEHYPEAVSLRSHSLNDSGRLNRIFSRYGINIKSNYLLYMKEGIDVVKMPYEFELFEAPIYFLDGNFLFTQKDIKKFSIDMLNLGSPGLKIVGFHPVHIYLNTDDYTRYEDAKRYMDNKERFDRYINRRVPGIRDLFTGFLDHVDRNRIRTYKLRDLIA